MEEPIGFNYRDEKPGGAQRYIIPALLKLLKEYRIQERILDIGCGNGSMARQLQSAGYRVWG